MNGPYKAIGRTGLAAPNANGYFVQNAIGATVAGPFPDRFATWREVDRLDRAELAPPAVVAILNIASSAYSELPRNTRTVDVPAGLDEGTGVCLAVGEDEDGIRFWWRLAAGGMNGGWITALPLSIRSPGERFMVESTDLDDRGRRMWWLSTIRVDP